MSNVPQDVIDDAVAAGFDTGEHGTVAIGSMHDLHRFAQLRAQRSNAEPVAWKLVYNGLDCTHMIGDSVWMKEAALNIDDETGKPLLSAQYGEPIYGQDVLDFIHGMQNKPLYTAPPDAGFAAGMMKAAEIAWQETYDQVHTKTGAIAEAATIAHAVKNKILSAIPADSKAALREVCLKVVKIVEEHYGYELLVPSALDNIINSVLEGKS